MATKRTQTVRPTKQKRPKTPWLQNALRSITNSTTSTLNSYAPNMSATLSSTTRLMRQLKKTRNPQQAKQIVTKNKYIKYANDAFRNALDDIKQGHLLGNKSRGDSAMTGDMDNNFDDLFGDSGSGVSFGDEGGGDVNITYVGDGGNATAEGFAALSQTMSRTADSDLRMQKASLDVFVSLASTSITQTAQLADVALGHLDAIEKNLATLVEYNNTNMNQFIETTTGFFERMGQMYAGQEDSPDDRQKDVTAADVFNANGGIDFNAYKKYVKQQFKNNLPPSLSMLAGMIDDDMIKMMASNPLGMASSMIVEYAMPKMVTTTIKGVEQAYTSMLPSLLDQLGKWGEEQSGSLLKELTGTVARSLGLNMERSTHVLKGNIEINRDAIPFDGETKMAITNIITKELREQTGYLKIIATGGTSKNKLKQTHGKMMQESTVFDYEENRFMTMRQIEERMIKNLQDSVENGFNRTGFGRFMKLASNQKSGKERDSFNNMLSQFYNFIEQSNDRFNYVNNEVPQQFKDAIENFHGTDDNKKDFLKVLEDIMNENPTLMYTLTQGRLAAKASREKEIDKLYQNAMSSNILQTNLFERKGKDGKQITVDEILDDYLKKEADKLGNVSSGSIDTEAIFNSRRDGINSEARDLFARVQQNARTSGNRFVHAAVTGNTREMYQVFGDTFAEAGKEVAHAMNENFFKPIKTSLFGVKNEDGFSEGGLFSTASNTLKDAANETMHMFTGKAYKDSKGEMHEESQDTIIHNIKDGIFEKFFGERRDENGNKIAGTGILGDLKSTFKESIVEWHNALFGTKSKKGEDVTTENIGDVVLDSVQDFLPHALAGGAVGGLLSILSSGGVLGALVGGPIGIIGLGAAAGLASRSEKFKEFIFGSEDDDDGIISKKVQDFFKEHKNLMLGSAVVGGATGTITGGGILGSLVGGPLAGAIIGMAGAYVTKSELFQSFLFGNEDEGFEGVVNSFKNLFKGSGDQARSLKKDAMFKGIGVTAGALTGAALMKVGLLPAMLGPAGPIGGALLGLGLAVRASGDTLKTWLFGNKKDKDDPDYKLGLFGQLSNMLKVNLGTPVKNLIRDIGDDMMFTIKHDILAPVQLAIKPLGDGFKRIAGSLMETAGNLADRVIGGIKDGVTPIVKAAATFIVRPARRMGTMLAKVTYTTMKHIVTLPFKGLRLMTNIIMSPVRKFVQSWLERAHSVLDTFKEGVKNKVKGAGRLIKRGVKGVGRGLRNAKNAAAEYLYENSTVASTVMDGYGALKGKVKTGIRDTKRTISSGKTVLMDYYRYGRRMKDAAERKKYADDYLKKKYERDKKLKIIGDDVSFEEWAKNDGNWYYQRYKLDAQRDLDKGALIESKRDRKKRRKNEELIAKATNFQFVDDTEENRHRAEVALRAKGDKRELTWGNLEAKKSGANNEVRLSNEQLVNMNPEDMDNATRQTSILQKILNVMTGKHADGTERKSRREKKHERMMEREAEQKEKEAALLKQMQEGGLQVSSMTELMSKLMNNEFMMDAINSDSFSQDLGNLMKKFAGGDGSPFRVNDFLKGMGLDPSKYNGPRYAKGGRTHDEISIIGDGGPGSTPEFYLTEEGGRVIPYGNEGIGVVINNVDRSVFSRLSDILDNSLGDLPAFPFAMMGDDEEESSDASEDATLGDSRDTDADPKDAEEVESEKDKEKKEDKDEFNMPIKAFGDGNNSQEGAKSLAQALWRGFKRGFKADEEEDEEEYATMSKAANKHDNFMTHMLKVYGEYMEGVGAYDAMLTPSDGIGSFYADLPGQDGDTDNDGSPDNALAANRMHEEGDENAAIMKRDANMDKARDSAKTAQELQAEREQERQETWREKLFAAVRDIADTTQIQEKAQGLFHKMWKGIFSKKGLITAALLLLFKKFPGLLQGIGSIAGKGLGFVEDLWNMLFGDGNDDGSGDGGNKNTNGNTAGEEIENIKGDFKDLTKGNIGGFLLNDYGESDHTTTSKLRILGKLGGIPSKIVGRISKGNLGKQTIREAASKVGDVPIIGRFLERRVNRKGRGLANKLNKTVFRDTYINEGSNVFKNLGSKLMNTGKDYLTGKRNFLGDIGAKIAGNKTVKETAEEVITTASGAVVQNADDYLAKQAAKNAAKEAGEKVVKETVSKGVEMATVETIQQTSEKNAKKLIEEAFEKLIKSISSKLSNKFGKLAITGVIADVRKIIGEAFEKAGKTMVGEMITKIMGVVGVDVGLAATGVGIVGVVAKNAVGLTLGAVDGLSGTAKLFHIDRDKVDGKMRVISTAIGALVGTTIGNIADIANQLFAQVTGKDVINIIATAIYRLISSKEDDAKLADAQEDFNQDYNEYRRKAIASDYKTKKKAGILESDMTEEEYVQKVLNGEIESNHKSEMDYNYEKNSSIIDKSVEGTIGIGKGASMLADAVAGNKVEAWFDKDGNVYIKEKDGKLLVRDKNGKRIGLVSNTSDIKKNFVSEKATVFNRRNFLDRGNKDEQYTVTDASGKKRNTDIFAYAKEIAANGGELPGTPTLTSYEDRSEEDKEKSKTEAANTYLKSSEDVKEKSGADFLVPNKDAGTTTEVKSLFSTSHGESLETKSDTIEKPGDKDWVEGKKSVNASKQKVNDALETEQATINEYGPFMEINDEIMISSSEALFDPKGNYYVRRGSVFDYYNSNAGLIEQNISKYRVNVIYTNGMLVKKSLTDAADKHSPSDTAKNAVEAILAARNETWDKAGKRGVSIWKDVAEQLGITLDNAQISQNAGLANATTATLDLTTTTTDTSLTTDTTDTTTTDDSSKKSTTDKKETAKKIAKRIERKKDNPTNASAFYSMPAQKKATSTSNFYPRNASANSGKGGRGTWRRMINAQYGGSGSGVATEGAPTTLHGFPYYAQTDERWADTAYEYKDDGATMADSGCGPAAMSMAIKGITGEELDPTVLASFAQETGTRDDNGTNWNFIGDAADATGLSSVQTYHPNKSFFDSSFASGNPVILSGTSNGEDTPYTSAGHYVVAVGKDSTGKIMVNDPRGEGYSRSYTPTELLKYTGSAWEVGKSDGGFGNAPLDYALGGFGKKDEDKKDDKKDDKKETTTKSTSANANVSAEAGQITDADMLNNFPFLLQNDPRWGSKPYTATGNSGQTIASSACGPTSMAMVLRSYGVNVSPVDTCDFALKHGHRTDNSGTSWGFFPDISKEYGLDCNDLGTSGDSIEENLKKSFPIIGSMGPGTFTRGGHFIVLSGIGNDGKIIVNDPASKDRSQKTYPTSTFTSEGHRYWSFSKDGKGSIGNLYALGSGSSSGGASSSGTASNANIFDRMGSFYGEMAARMSHGMLAGNWDNDWEKFWSGQDPAQTTTTTATTTGATTSLALAGGDNHEKIWNYLTQQKKLSPQGAAGIMGCWEHESGNDPRRVEGDRIPQYPGFDKVMATPESLDNYTQNILFPATKIGIDESAYLGPDGHYYPGIGLAQWTGPRGYNLMNYAKSKNLDWRQLDGQLEFFASEFDSRNLAGQLNASTTPENAAALFCQKFEGYRGSSATRQSTARQLYNKYTTTSTTSNTTTNTQNAGSGTGLIIDRATQLRKRKRRMGGRGLGNRQRMLSDKEKELMLIQNLAASGRGGSINFWKNRKFGGRGATAAEAREAVIGWMLSLIGRNSYSMNPDRVNAMQGVDGHGTGDCSSTCYLVYQTALNMKIGSYTGDMWNSGQMVQGINKSWDTVPDTSQMMPGDLIFFYSHEPIGANLTDELGHVEMYIGSGYVAGHGRGTGPKINKMTDYISWRTGKRSSGNWACVVRYIQEGQTYTINAPDPAKYKVQNTFTDGNGNSADGSGGIIANTSATAGATTTTDRVTTSNDIFSIMGDFYGEMSNRATDGSLTGNWNNDWNSYWHPAVSTGGASTAVGGGTPSNFPKYEGLTEDQKALLGRTITRETGGDDRVAAYQEASQMANLNEVQYGREPTADNLYKTVTGGWYAGGAQSGNITDLAKEAVEQVFVNGYRALPRYVVEHDWFPNDIVGAKDRSAYTFGEDVKNVYHGAGEHFQFFDFFGKNHDGDISGYYNRWYEPYKMDVPYSVDGWQMPAGAPVQQTATIGQAAPTATDPNATTNGTASTSTTSTTTNSTSGGSGTGRRRKSIYNGKAVVPTRSGMSEAEKRQQFITRQTMRANGITEQGNGVDVTSITGATSTNPNIQTAKTIIKQSNLQIRTMEQSVEAINQMLNYLNTIAQNTAETNTHLDGMNSLISRLRGNGSNVVQAPPQTASGKSKAKSVPKSNTKNTSNLMGNGKSNTNLKLAQRIAAGN